MTPALVAAVKDYNITPLNEDKEAELRPNEPSLANPTIGNPISHGQILDIAKALKASPASQDVPSNHYNLDDLLRGSHIFIPPPPPRPEPTQAYKDLMARLRAISEAQEYATISSHSNTSNPFSISSRNSLAMSQPTHDPFASPSDDDITFADVNRQLTLIINVLVTIIACGIAIWLAAGHIAAPQRLALAMGGALLVAGAEVAVYMGYLRKLGEAKEKERGTVERKVIKKTWTIGGSLSEKDAVVDLGKETKDEVNGAGIRFRAGKRR